MAVETDFDKVLEDFRKRFVEIEEKSKKDEVRRVMLETEVENLKKRNEELEGKIAAVQKVVVDPNYVERESDRLIEVMIENKVLECEKRKAETEVCFWKEKVKELEAKMKDMKDKVKEDVDVRKRLSSEEDGCANKKSGMSTPGVDQSPLHGVIDIRDEDGNSNEIPKVRECDDLTKGQCSSENNLQKTNLEHIGEEHMEEFRVHASNTRNAKRKRAAKIVASDDEDSHDDNAPICTLKTRHSSRVSTDSEEEVEENVSRRYITRLRKSESKNKQHESVINLNKIVSSSEDEEDNDDVDESESEGKGLGGFIVDSSEIASDCDIEGSHNADESEDALNEYKVTMDIIRRKKISNMKWDLEADMLSDFGKDLELCMRAVCALYRQQTADEKASKLTTHQNERGFSQADASRGCMLAEFLTDGDPNCDLNKTVEELKEYGSKEVKLCRALAATYSKQLYEIYQNKEDPYFLPQR
ncbi:hypothetical protein HanPSC8_Chr09g0370301 [Helianthus annuus]|nr:hypothetical protein HanHA89_Chr09g0336241 [Helianthus annuus]KAJ0892801.1 hypothetical protein HanPSC8_Chr09g0370301 [Helianthus annuus]